MDRHALGHQELVTGAHEERPHCREKIFATLNRPSLKHIHHYPERTATRQSASKNTTKTKNVTTNVTQANQRQTLSVVHEHKKPTGTIFDDTTRASRLLLLLPRSTKIGRSLKDVVPQNREQREGTEEDIATVIEHFITRRVPGDNGRSVN